MAKVRTYLLLIFTALICFVSFWAFSEELQPESPIIPDIDPETPVQPVSENLNWLKVYYKDAELTRLNAHAIDELDSIFFSDNVSAINIASQRGGIAKIPMDSILSMEMGTNIPTVIINTDSEITSKEDYLEADFGYFPYNGEGDTIQTKVSIRGRGNTSWFHPKKPYRLKFDKKQSIGCLNKAKSFVLLSNYIDNTLMRHVVAYKIAELIGLPYTNIPQPVNLVLNGVDKGSYLLTNKVGINAGSIDIDEKKGVFWEIDTYFDEEFKFMSRPFNQPCMLKDPDPYEICNGDTLKAQEYFEDWKEDLTEAFEAVRMGNWTDAFDAEQLVKFILVNNIVQNRELTFPKSLYLYKESKEGKYKFGPVWDFDWALGYTAIPKDVLIASNQSGINLWLPIFGNETFREMFQQELDDFLENHLDELIEFIDNYAALIRDSALQDALLWPAEHYEPKYEKNPRSTAEFDKNVEWLKDFIMQRIEIIKQSVNFSLF